MKNASGMVRLLLAVVAVTATAAADGDPFRRRDLFWEKDWKKNGVIRIFRHESSGWKEHHKTKVIPEPSCTKPGQYHRFEEKWVDVLELGQLETLGSMANWAVWIGTSPGSSQPEAGYASPRVVPSRSRSAVGSCR